LPVEKATVWRSSEVSSAPCTTAHHPTGGGIPGPIPTHPRPPHRAAAPTPRGHRVPAAAGAASPAPTAPPQPHHPATPRRLPAPPAERRRPGSTPPPPTPI